jgi:hypothetical protein
VAQLTTSTCSFCRRIYYDVLLSHFTHDYTRSTYLQLLQSTVVMPTLDYSQYPFDSKSQIRLLELSYRTYIDRGNRKHREPVWTFASPMSIDSEDEATQIPLAGVCRHFL